MRQLIVKNFGPVSDASIEIRKFNLFIGEQSIGKSTLAKLVTIFTEYIHIYLLKAGGDEIWTRIMDTYDLTMYAEQPYVIRFADDDINGAHVSIEIKHGVVDCHVIDENNQELNAQNSFVRIVGAKTVYRQDVYEQLRDMEINEDTFPTYLSYLMNSLYIPAERIVGAQLNKLLPVISMGKEQLPMNVLRYLSELNNAKVKYPNLRMDLLDVSYLKKGEEDWIELDNKKLIPLKYASSGIQSALPLLLVLIDGAAHKNYKSFVVEEPECNLFPQKQVDLLQFMVNAIYQHNRILTITTHSPYLLSSLNVLMLAHQLYQDETLKEQVETIVDPKYMLDSKNVAVYFLGGKDQYCKSIIAEQTGLVSVNQLDSVSEFVGDQFDQLYDIYVQSKRRKS